MPLYINEKIIVAARFKVFWNLACCDKVCEVSVALQCNSLPNSSDSCVFTKDLVSCLQLCANCLWPIWDVPVEQGYDVFESGTLMSDGEREIAKQFFAFGTWKIERTSSQNSTHDCWKLKGFSWSSEPRRKNWPWQLAASNRNRIRTVSLFHVLKKVLEEEIL